MYKKLILLLLLKPFSQEGRKEGRKGEGRGAG
jgi:hypothetical protein